MFSFLFCFYSREKEALIRSILPARAGGSRLGCREKQLGGEGGER
jgi:hypothetical protein